MSANIAGSHARVWIFGATVSNVANCDQQHGSATSIAVVSSIVMRPRLKHRDLVAGLLGLVDTRQRWYPPVELA